MTVETGFMGGSDGGSANPAVTKRRRSQGVGAMSEDSAGGTLSSAPAIAGERNPQRVARPRMAGPFGTERPATTPRKRRGAR